MDADRNMTVAEVWRPALIAMALMLVTGIAAYWSTAASIVSIWWRSGTFTHGFLIVPIVVFLIWRMRDDVARIAPRPQRLALIPLLGLLGVWLASRLLDVNVGQQFAWVALIPALAWLLFGTPATRALIFPLAYLFFAVPFGEFLVPTLQDITAAFTVWALNLTGIPVLWEGRLFYIPSGSFEVAAACSGVRYLIASIALGTLFAYITYHSNRRRALFVALAVVVPIIANGVRAYIIVMLAHLSGHTLAVGVDHFIYGWAFFGLVMLALFWIGNRFRDAPPVAAPVVAASSTMPANPKAWFALSAVAATLLIATPLSESLLFAGNGRALEVQLPAGRGDWTGPRPSVDGWMPRFAGASSQQRAEYRRGADAVQVYAAYYARQTQDAELINSENGVFDQERERRLGDEPVTLALPDGGAWTAHETRVQTPGGARVIWHWYVVDGVDVVSSVKAKLIEARARLSRSTRGSSVIVVAADYDTQPDQARQRLREFLGALRDELRASVGAGP